MNKKFIFFFAILITALGFLFYKTRLQPSCTYPKWVKENDNTVNLLLSELPNGTEKGCRMPITVCTGNACSAPIKWLECNKITSVCGENISCECK